MARPSYDDIDQEVRRDVAAVAKAGRYKPGQLHGGWVLSGAPMYLDPKAINGIIDKLNHYLETNGAVKTIVSSDITATTTVGALMDLVDGKF